MKIVTVSVNRKWDRLITYWLALVLFCLTSILWVATTDMLTSLFMECWIQPHWFSCLYTNFAHLFGDNTVIRDECIQDFLSWHYYHFLNMSYFSSSTDQRSNDVHLLCLDIFWLSLCLQQLLAVLGHKPIRFIIWFQPARFSGMQGSNLMDSRDTAVRPDCLLVCLRIPRLFSVLSLT